MGIKEFSGKTLLFIVLPILVFCGVRNCNDIGTQQLSDFRGCVRRLQQMPPIALTIHGEHEVKSITVTAALRQLPERAAALHWVSMPIAQHRFPLRSYRVTVTMKNQPTQDIYLSQTRSGQEVVSWGGDSVFLDEKRTLFPFIDSLYQRAHLDPPQVIDLRWMSFNSK